MATHQHGRRRIKGTAKAKSEGEALQEERKKNGPKAFEEECLPSCPSGDWNQIPKGITQTFFDGLPDNKLAFVLDNVFSEQECDVLISWSEQHGYQKAALGHGTRVIEQVRKSDRCIIDSHLLSNIILQRIRSFLPEKFCGESLINLNERLRFLRYDPGGYFRPHCDGYYNRPDWSEISQITMQLYLNGGFQGGETTFLRNNDRTRIPCVPKPGRILIFEHKMRHEGSVLHQGRKYTVRSDLMYTNHTGFVF